MSACRIEPFRCTGRPCLSRRAAEDFLEARGCDLDHRQPALGGGKFGDRFCLDGVDRRLEPALAVDWTPGQAPTTPGASAESRKSALYDRPGFAKGLESTANMPRLRTLFPVFLVLALVTMFTGLTVQGSR